MIRYQWRVNRYFIWIPIAIWLLAIPVMRRMLKKLRKETQKEIRSGQFRVADAWISEYLYEKVVIGNAARHVYIWALMPKGVKKMMFAEQAARHTQKDADGKMLIHIGKTESGDFFAFTDWEMENQRALALYA